MEALATTWPHLDTIGFSLGATAFAAAPRRWVAVRYIIPAANMHMPDCYLKCGTYLFAVGA